MHFAGSRERPEGRLEELGVAIHGQSFACVSVAEDLAASYPRAVQGMLNIGLLHTSATGRAGHDSYAPCTVESLRLKGYDYWALGHVHTRETLSEDPWIVFPGNLQGRHVRETGPKGCMLVTVEQDQVIKPEFQPLDVLRWERANVDVGDAIDLDDVLDRVARDLERLVMESAGRSLAVRVELQGVSPVRAAWLADRHRLVQEIRSQSNQAGQVKIGQGELWIEKVKLVMDEQGRAPYWESVPEGALAELAGLFSQVRSDRTLLDEAGFDLTDVLKKLPSELKDVARAEDPEWIDGVLAEAESLLFGRLLKGKESS